MPLGPLLLQMHVHNQRALQNLRLARQNEPVTWKVQLSLQYYSSAFVALHLPPSGPPSVGSSLVAPPPPAPPSLGSYLLPPPPLPLPVTALELCRRLARKRREAELVAFSATRPDNYFESPADVQAIRQAQQNIGDFKLKSDPEYIPPEVAPTPFLVAPLLFRTNTFL